MSSTTVVSPFFRVSFPNVLKPKRNDLNGQDEYSLVALFPYKKGSKEMKEMEAAVEIAIKEKWGDKRPSNLRSPFRDQAERAKDGKLPDGHVEGHVFVNMKNKQKPGLVNQENQDIIDSSEFYSGCYARAQVRAFAYDNKGNRGVSFSLQNIQKVKDGDPLSGRMKAQDAFAPVELSNDGAGGIFDN